MSFLLLKQKIQKLLKQPITKKSLIAFGVVTSLFFTFQNCSETKFQEIQLSSQSVDGLSLCSLDDMSNTAVSLSITGYNNLPLSSMDMRSIPKDSFTYIWINGFSDLASADWYISKNGEPERSFGSGDKVTYPQMINKSPGLTPGNYKVRINVSKVCENLAQNSGALSKAQIEASSRLEKNIFVQFNVINPQETGCQSLAGVFLNADDPKTVNKDVNFSVALPVNCTLPVSYNFGDGSPNLENANLSEKHQYVHSGQYTALAKLGNDGTTIKKDLTKKVVILAECPKPQNLFISGPSSLRFGSVGNFELQNYNNNSCNLGVSRVTFKKDGQTNLTDDAQAPYKIQTSWDASEAKTHPNYNSVVAEVYFNSPEDYGVTNPYIVKKTVILIDSVTGCTPEALASLSISGPTSAVLDSNLTHVAVVPECMRNPSFAGNDSIDWSLEEVTNAGAASIESLGHGLSITRQYAKIGLFSLKAKVKDTKVGEVNLQSYLYILDNKPPVCSLFTYNEWGVCESTGTRTRTVKTAKPLNCAGGDPVLVENCTYTPPAPVTCTSFTYSEYGPCNPDGKKYRNLVSSLPAGCTGGNPALSEACTYVPPVCTSFIYGEWGQCQAEGKQYRQILNSIPEGCAGGTPATSQTCTYVPPVPPQCTSHNYNAWGACEPDGTQHRTVSSSVPAGCAGGVAPVLEQSCPYTPPTCTTFTYNPWQACQPDGKQIRTVATSAPPNCTGGNPLVQQNCTYTPPQCTGYNYNPWQSCQPDNKQHRTVSSTIPALCSGGAVPVLEQQCTYTPPTLSCEGYNYSDWGSCEPDNKKRRSVLSNYPAGCIGVPATAPVLEQGCTYVPPVVTCNSFTYSAWQACQPSNIQIRTVTSSLPAGCTGGNPDTSQACQYVPPMCTYTYTGWSSCQPNGQQTRSVTSTSPAGCAGGTPVTTQNCNYVPPTCTSFTYGAWGACQSNNLQTRSVLTSSPANCQGGNPITSQGCQYVPPQCSYTYSAWSACQSNSLQTRTLLSSSPAGCAGTPELSQSCTYVPPQCTYSYSAWGACQPNSLQTRNVLGSSPSGCVGTPTTIQGCTYTPPQCTSFTYTAWGSCQANNTQQRNIVTSSPGSCVGGSPVLSQGCCFNEATNPGACNVCPAGQTISALTGRCETLAANRWCHLISAGGPQIGYQDPGAVHEPGCFHATLNRWYAVGDTINFDGHAIRCDSGPSGQFPVPDNRCAPTRCGALVSSAACSVTKQCANGTRLPAVNGMVPNTANIAGGYREEVVVDLPNVSDSNKYRIDEWNTHGATLKMTCDYVSGNQLMWRQSAGGYCTATYFMSQAESDAEPSCASVPVNWTRDNCAAWSCEYDGQRYDNSTSCCQSQYGCGFGGYGTCRFRNNQWYIEGLSCGGRGYVGQYPISCK